MEEAWRVAQVSTVLTSIPYQRLTTKKNRSITTIPVELFDVGLVDVSTVDTGPRGSSPTGVLAAGLGTLYPGPGSSSPVWLPSAIEWGLEVMVRRRPGPGSSQGRPTARGWRSTNRGLCVLHEGPTYPEYTRPSSSGTRPSCIAPRRRRPAAPARRANPQCEVRPHAGSPRLPQAQA